MAAPLNAGAKAPSFALPADSGGRAALRDFRGRKLVLFFYPKADTAGCTREAQDFTRLAPSFAKANTAIVGISADPVKALERFKTKRGLSVILASDETLETLKAYGVWVRKSMYGRTFMGVQRTTVLIDAAGRIARVWEKVKVDGHADEVLTAAKEL